MTIPEAIEFVKSMGGRLSLRGSKVVCRIPEGADSALIEFLRQNRDGIAIELRLREEYVGKGDRCYTHGTHDDWYQHPGDGPDRVCARCHPQL